MNITRRSPLTGITTTLDLNVTPEQMAEYESLDRWVSRGPIQDIFPHLTAAEREFIKTGYTAADWDEIFPEEK